MYECVWCSIIYCWASDKLFGLLFPSWWNLKLSMAGGNLKWVINWLCIPVYTYTLEEYPTVVAGESLDWSQLDEGTRARMLNIWTGLKSTKHMCQYLSLVKVHKCLYMPRICGFVIFLSCLKIAIECSRWFFLNSGKAREKCLRKTSALHDPELKQVGLFS